MKVYYIFVKNKEMAWIELYSYINQKYSSKKRLIIAIDGVDAAGKSHFARHLQQNIPYSSILISIDDFHNTQNIRYAQGKHSPLGFYEDSYNYDIFIKETLIPFIEEKNNIRTKYLDLEKDKLSSQFKTIDKNCILLIEGIFLHRKELLSYWDFSIFLDIPLELSLKRNVERTISSTPYANHKLLINNYYQRYILGQKIYLKREKPKNKANIIIDNSNFLEPKIIKYL